MVIAVAGFGGLIAVRKALVPSFQAVDGDYRYQWHRVDNEKEWKDFPVKYKGAGYCKDCHAGQYAKITASRHAKVQCENCHNPAVNHPDNPPKLAVDRSRELCLRCHSSLPYRPVVYVELPKGAVQLKMKNPDEHNPGVECVTCHNPHNAGFKR
ncbi:MAG: cytochrome c3 family protein [Nitrospirota bacterium]|nr:cytochrome c3 family protein [Nitrospirota bacterium]